MTDIVFYDFEFNRLGIYPRYTSMNFTKNYCGYGTAELHFSPATSEIVKLLDDNKYVFFAVDGNYAIVTGWIVDEDIAIFGRTPEWLLTKRGIPPITLTKATPENIARDAVTSAAGDFLVLGDSQGLGVEQEYSTNEVRILHDVICEVLNTQKLGFEVFPDVVAKRFVFKVYSGNEALALVSKSNRTAYGMNFTVEKQDVVTGSGWYERQFVDMGEWDAQDNSPSLKNKNESNFFKYYKITSTRTRFDLNCVEGEYLYCNTPDGVWKTSKEKPEHDWAYIDNSNVSGAKKWDAVLNGVKTETEAVAKIAQLVQNEMISANVLRLKYGTDYFLGDIVGVHMEIGEFKKAEKMRVTAVNIYEDLNETGVTPILSSLEE